MSKPSILTLTIPPNAEPGIDSLTFQYQDQELEFLVPSDAKPGDVLEIQLGLLATATDGTEVDPDDGENDADEETGEKSSSELLESLGGMEEDENVVKNDENLAEGERSGITTVSLHHHDNDQSNTSLHLLESIATNNKPEDVGDGTNAMVWPSGIVLAQALTSSPGSDDIVRHILDSTTRSKVESSHHEQCIHCLELGSGLGVCGLALAHVLSRRRANDTCADARILLTDWGDDAIPLLNENIHRNRHVFQSSEEESHKVSVEAASLLWGETLSSNEKFHIILGSDLLYNTQDTTYEPLLRTIRHHLHPEGRIFLAVRWRKPDLERQFFHRAAKLGLEFVLWDTVLDHTPDLKRRCPCRLGWEEYGDAECEASNAFFHDMVVSIGGNECGGVTKSLAEVQESDLEGMSEEEYAAFEECQIQIYVGKFVCDSKSCSVDDTILRKRGIGDIST
ncbi:hypothetical protein HJC23_002089 [Cyclotella cryptica]|uniref:Calmodulin-lysine N-methyltransferase n=1 Tax=Cyclotella cryptica TaxID=29204 RepID=A0ABD3PAY4_9STRA|eukprot:CCRYP_017109-RA/>CCRYP_017109-RA protein AED:0.00 eAED:0.00 QI:106/-1/1/1/-1/1/1/901/451